jgi:hypothetical protein
MARDLATLLARMRNEGYFVDVSSNQAAQFGPPARQYLGATLLPEQQVPENAYREESIRYRTIVANDGTRYSPVQKKGGELIGSFLVETGSSDIGREFTAREYDMLLRMLRRGDEMAAMERLIGWSDTVLNRALVEHNEKQIWDAVVTAQVIRRGNNGYTETVPYSNPAGHRFNATGTWSNDAFDPMDDIIAGANLLDALGYTVNRIFYGLPVRTILQGNAKMQARSGLGVINIAGSIEVARQRATIEALNAVFNSNNLPAPEEYNLQYRTSTGSGYFLARNVLVMCATTGQDATVDLGDSERLLPNVLGYNAIGTPTGQPDPGRVIRLQEYTNKPPRIEGEAWQENIPVIAEPEAIVVIGAIA